MDKNKNLHKGHRNRLRMKIKNIDSDMFEPHELLEFLLYSVMSQKNTNELAHNLLEHFDNVLTDVFNASVNELMQVKGIGLQSALMLNSIPILSRLYFASENKERIKITSQNIFVYSRDAASQLGNDGIVASFLNAKSEVISEKILTNNTFTQNGLIDMRILISHIIDSGAASMILIHKSRTSDENLNQNILLNIDSISSYLTAFNIKFIDYIVISSTDIISMRESGAFGEEFY